MHVPNRGTTRPWPRRYIHSSLYPSSRLTDLLLCISSLSLFGIHPMFPREKTDSNEDDTTGGSKDVKSASNERATKCRSTTRHRQQHSSARRCGSSGGSKKMAICPRLARCPRRQQTPAQTPGEPTQEAVRPGAPAYLGDDRKPPERTGQPRGGYHGLTQEAARRHRGTEEDPPTPGAPSWSQHDSETWGQRWGQWRWGHRQDSESWSDSWQSGGQETDWWGSPDQWHTSGHQFQTSWR